MAIDEQESQDESQQISEAEAPTAENTDEDQSPESPSGQDEVSRRFKALEDRLERERETRERLEESLRLQERYFQQQKEGQRQTQRQDPPEEGLSDELAVLDKALNPLLGRRFKEQLDPLNQRWNALAEDNDALRFEMFLSRNEPGVMEDEDQYNRIMQQVNQIRQAARERGMYVSRVDAYCFGEGLGALKQKFTQRKQKRSTAVQEEGKRIVAAKTATATSPNSEGRPNPNAGINAIREKANRGERLTDAERTKFRDYLANANAEA